MKLLEHKIPPPVIGIFFAWGLWLAADAAPALRIELPWREVICAALVLTSLVFDVAGLLAFRRASTTINPLKPHNASTFVTTGIYRLSRNPMYFGLLLLLLAWAVYLGNVAAFMLLPLFVAFMNRFQIMPEERVLAERFGAEFAVYKQAVRRWI